MEYIITSVILFLIFIFFRKFLKSPRVFFDIDPQEIRDYLYILLYRGNIHIKSTLIIEKRSGKESLCFSKYKERGNVGIYLHIPFFKSWIKLKKSFKILINKYKLDFYYEKIIDFDISEVLTVDFKQDLSLASEFLQIVIKKIFKDNKNIDLNFTNVSEDPNAILGFSEEDVPDFEKMGLDITKPVTNGGYLYYKLGPFWGNILKIFGY